MPVASSTAGIVLEGKTMTRATAHVAAAVVTAFEAEGSLQFQDTRLILILFIIAILFFIAGFALRDVLGKRALRRQDVAKGSARPERAH